MLTQPAIAKATRHNRESLPLQRQATIEVGHHHHGSSNHTHINRTTGNYTQQQGGAHGTRVEPSAAGQNLSRQVVTRLPP